MKRGDFYEDDEPLANVVAAFMAGEHAMTATPVRGWTYWLTPKAAANWEQVATHYQAELVKARQVANGTGEGAELYEGLMNEALDNLAALRGDQP